MSLYRFLVRGGTAANLAAVNEVPLARELVIATDAGVRDLRLGNGTDNWADLPNLLQKDFAPSFSYTVETGSTADSDPGAGLLKWNNATQGSATFLYIDDVTADTATDLSTYFSTLATNSTTGFVHIIQANDSAKWQIWKWTAITDGTGYFKFAVTLMASAASFSDAAGVRVSFHPMPAGGGGGGGSGAMTYIGNASLGAAATNLAIAGLDLTADTCYFVVFKPVIATATPGTVRLFYNSDTTTTNYNALRIDVGSFGVSRTLTNTAEIMATDAIEAGAVYTGHIAMDAAGKARAAFTANRRVGAGYLMGVHNHLWDIVANPTGMTFSHTVANGLGAGTRADIWKVDN